MAFNPQTINKELDMANLAKHNVNYSAIKTELDAHDTHIAAQTAHGSTPAATAGKIMQRDSTGRAKVAAPSASDDIARKAEVDAVQAGLVEHEADNVAHLTSAEHTKLAGIEEGAEVNQNAFAQVNNVVAGAESDTLTIAGGIGITVSANPATKTLTVTATGTATPGEHGAGHTEHGADPIPTATETDGGIMSAADKKTHNNMADPPRAKYTTATVKPLPYLTWTTPNWDTKNFDTNDFVSQGNNGEIIINEAGTYLIYANIVFSANAVGFRNIMFEKTGIILHIKPITLKMILGKYRQSEVLYLP